MIREYKVRIGWTYKETGLARSIFYYKHHKDDTVVIKRLELSVKNLQILILPIILGGSVTKVTPGTINIYGGLTS